MHSNKTFFFSDFLWDLWCISSVIGIWPRFIEPNLVSTTQLQLQIPDIPPALKGTKILQLSDLHLNSRVPDSFLKKIIETTNLFSPDLIVFTGDFICKSTLKDQKRLQSFLNRFQAPYGCYAILGNHDYAQYVSTNRRGDYDVQKEDKSLIIQGFQQLFSSTPLTKMITAAAQQVPLHEQLIDTLAKTPFKLLHNATKVVSIKESFLNICGLGDYTLGRCNPEKAFVDYHTGYPGIILTHNPDSIPLLKEYPGHIVLCGHTHGGQVNLPWISSKVMQIENPQFKRGLKKSHNKLIYINRGIGSNMRFRWFSVPELLLLTLQ